MDEREQILAEIQRVARAIAPEQLTSQAFKRQANLSASKVRYHFGSWNEAVRAAGLEPNPSGSRIVAPLRLDEADLLTAIGELWATEGRRPTEGLMNARGRYSVKPYRDRWGTFGKAVAFYQAQFGEPAPAGDQPLPIGNATPQAPDKVKPSPVVLPATFKPKAQANPRRILYGEPIDFRGLRYAPINEQGVVYLFGMVSRELGFLVESVRTDYPDCEGKRALDRSGSKWQHVRIEFEFRARTLLSMVMTPPAATLSSAGFTIGIIAPLKSWSCETPSACCQPGEK